MNAATEEDLVRRAFTAEHPDALWLTDITEHPVGEGKLYCAAVMAVFSRKIIGGSIAARQADHRRSFHSRHAAAAPRPGRGAIAAACPA